MPSQAPRQITQIVGENIAAARQAAELTQREVAEQVGALVEGSKLSPTDVSRWERGGIEPGAKYRQALAAVLFDGDLSAMYVEHESAAA